MGNRIGQMFLKRRYINDQKAHKVMFNIVSHQGIANPNDNVKRYHFTLTKMAISEKQKITNVREDVDKVEPSNTAGRNVKWYSHSANSSAFPQS